MSENIVLSVALGLLGLVAGSFAGATVWRLRAMQLREDAKSGEKVKATDKHQIEKLQQKPLHSDRSVCLHCGHVLEWYDLLPLLSWIGLQGKCRYCHKSIGWFEPVIELSVAAFFLLSYSFWPTPLTTTVDIAQFVIWLVAGVGLAILFVYDAKWFLLPDILTFPLIALGVVNAAIVIAVSHFSPGVIISIILSCAVLSGFYYLIYVFSQRQWVGFGDVKLGLALALLLADWQLAILALFLANLIGSLVVLPSMVSGKLKRQTHIPLGPLLIMGWAIAGLFGSEILDWYIAFTLGV